MSKKYDFAGWATRNNQLCSDGRTIIKDAFKANDGQKVPLVWNHQHNDSFNVLGHAMLENRDEGVYAFCYLNDTAQGKNMRQLLAHGDVTSLSIFANGLKQRGRDVLHGIIREVSVVLSGANPGAYIETVLAHSDENDESAVIFTGETLVEVAHSDDGTTDETLSHAVDEEKKEEEKPMDDDKIKKEEKDTKEEDTKEETIQEVFDSMSEKQKNVTYAMIGAALEEAKGKKQADDDEEEEDKKSMKHNVFDNEQNNSREVICHADQQEILELAKKPGVGSFKTALAIYAEDNELQHDATAGGFVQPDAEGNVTLLFPEYKDLRPGAPELITNDQGWISTVMNKVHKQPISRIRTRYVDIRNAETLRAKGYQKGKQKKLSGNFKLALRTTEPHTVYVRNQLHRDDIIDITDFDYVQYLYNIDRMMLNEELATAIMLGDGRDDTDTDKIPEANIRPIWLDDDLYTIHVDLDIENFKNTLQGTGTGVSFGESFITAEAFIAQLLFARENFRGSGTPDMFITPHMLNVMLLARDMNGRRIYDSKAQLAAALNVGEIYTVEQFENKTRTEGEGATAKTKKLLGIVCNLADYSVGHTKGGEITHFTQFDIDFNQQKSLIETRLSGALTRLWSAIAIEEDVTNP